MVVVLYLKDRAEIGCFTICACYTQISQEASSITLMGDSPVTTQYMGCRLWVVNILPTGQCFSDRPVSRAADGFLSTVTVPILLSSSVSLLQSLGRGSTYQRELAEGRKQHYNSILLRAVQPGMCAHMDMITLSASQLGQESSTDILDSTVEQITYTGFN
jgi:hypothetical protein